MERNKIKAVIIDPTKTGYEVKEIEPDFRAYQSVIGCDAIDIVDQEIDGEPYTIVVDDEGMLKSPHWTSACTADGQARLTGTIIICRSANGYETSLTEDDVERITGNIAIVSQRDSRHSCLILSR